MTNNTDIIADCRFHFNVPLPSYLSDASRFHYKFIIKYEMVDDVLCKLHVHKIIYTLHYRPACHVYDGHYCFSCVHVVSIDSSI
jgi:hypothetical protein